MKKNFTEAGYGFDNTDLLEKDLSQTLLFQSSVKKSNLLFSFSTSRFLWLNPLGGIIENTI